MPKKHNKKSKIEDYINIFKYHGVINGTRRAIDQFFQNDVYDYINGTNFSETLGGDDFYSANQGAETAQMHYQPVYTDAIKKPLKYLIKNYPVVGASSTCFIDLGCGRGKALHIAKSNLQHVTTIGVELNSVLINDAKINLTKLGEKAEIKQDFVEANVNDVDYNALLSKFDVVIVFNKNSFDKETTKNTLEKIKAACVGKDLFYIYSNPVFERLFKDYNEIFSMSGWHKNWNTKVFEVQT